LLYEDETILWRFALPRAGWWRKVQRARLPLRPLSQSQINARNPSTPGVVAVSHVEPYDERRTAQCHGAVQYGTAKVSINVPHFDARELRQYIHQVMATSANRERGRDGRRSQRDPSAHKLDATLEHYHGKFASILTGPLWSPPHPIEGFWRVMKDTIGPDDVLAIFSSYTSAHAGY